MSRRRDIMETGIEDNDRVPEKMRSFAMVCRGTPEQFTELAEHAKRLGLYIVYTRTSFQKLKIQEIPF